MIDLHLPLFRAHSVLRAALAVITILIIVSRRDEIINLGLMVAVLAVMVVVTVATALLYPSARFRRPWVFIADVVVTSGLVLTTPLVLSPSPAGGVVHSAVSYWAIAAPLAIALWRGWLFSGLAVITVMAAVIAVSSEVSVRAVAEAATGALVVLSAGWFISRLRTSTREREQMYAVAAGMAERQRLARIVHDGVLQVLAMVEREGRALGPRGLRLARSAHDAEAQLRALLQDTDIDVTAPETVDVSHTNLSGMLDKHASHGVSIATPPDTVLIESRQAHEIDAAVTEALSNVTKHAGPDAQAWVLLESEGDELIISIRDNGRGGTTEEFAAAASRGRMGMRHSIYGRLADLGGSATLRTAPGQGTEWEFRIPTDKVSDET